MNWNDIKKELWNPESTVPVMYITAATVIVYLIGRAVVG